MKIVFFGSDDFSLPALKACVDSPYDVALVITTPDRKKGRGMHLLPTVIKTYANEKAIRVKDPATLKDEELIAEVAALNPDVFVVSSYGKLIPNEWLEFPSKVALNVHPSLLPLYRGASPLNWPIINGDKETGVSIMEVVEKLDSGDVFAQQRFALDNDITSESLAEKLANQSYDMVLQVLDQVAADSLPRNPQDDSLATYAGKIEKKDGELDWSWSALKMDRRVRGLKPWPGTWVSFNGEPLILVKTKVVLEQPSNGAGVLQSICKDGSIYVGTGEGVLQVERVKPSGKKEMGAADFARGKRLELGYQFDSVPSEDNSE